MNSYLEIAEAVLRNARRPMGPRTILAEAYRLGMVPTHLHGATQHKTLQARLSEDVLVKKEHSAFFRTAPGKFFLREFLKDTTLPEEYRTPIAARRRVRELQKGPALALRKSDLALPGDRCSVIEKGQILDLIREDRFSYDDPKAVNEDLVFVWSYVTVTRSTEVLSYRVGKYRENRDSFLFKKSIGFSTLVNQDEMTLFNVEDLGIVDSGVRATQLDLDVPPESENDQALRNGAALNSFLWVPSKKSGGELLAVVELKCPEWFEPLKRRLAINDLCWLDLASPVNDIDDFDPWSRYLVSCKMSGLVERHSDIMDA